MNTTQTSATPRPLSRHNLAHTIATGYLPLFLATLIVVLPQAPTFSNYVEATHRVPFARFFFNSVIVTVIGSAIKCLLAIFTAYALVFARFPLKRVIFVAILVALMIPPQLAVLPNYILISALGGQNTYWGIILPGLGTAFGTFLLRQHFLTLPASILESAEIDGAGHWQRLWAIVVPISVPTIATVGLVTIVSEWNDYIWPLIITTSPEMMTLPVGLTLLINSDSSSQKPGEY